MQALYVYLLLLTRESVQGSKQVQIRLRRGLANWFLNATNLSFVGVISW